MITKTGCGALTSHLHARFPNCNVYGIELDRQIIEIGQACFGLQRDGDSERLHLVCADGKEWIAHPPAQLDFCFIDVDAKESTPDLYFPPLDFVSMDFLLHVRDTALVSGTGMLAVNMACKHASGKFRSLLAFTRVFANVVAVNATECGDDHHIVVFSWGVGPVNDAELNTLYTDVLSSCPLPLRSLISVVNSQGQLYRQTHDSAIVHSLEPAQIARALKLSCNGKRGLVSFDTEVWLFDRTCILQKFVQEHAYTSIFFCALNNSLALLFDARTAEQAALWLDAVPTAYLVFAELCHPRLGASSWAAQLVKDPRILRTVHDCLYA